MHFHLTRTSRFGARGIQSQRLSTWATEGEAQIQAERSALIGDRDDAYDVEGPCGCPEALAPESAQRLLAYLQETTVQILARQRAYGMHDPSCPAFKVNRPGFDNLIPRPAAACGCWLSEPADR